MDNKMHLFRAITFLIVTTYLISSCLSEDSQCTGLINCTTCIQKPECAWCSQSDFHGQDKKPLPRCNSVKGHAELGRFQCEKTHLFQHKNNMEIKRDESLSNGDNERRAVPIRPQKLSIQLRVNDTIKFQMGYKEVEDYPLDLYYLMDGTYTMKDDKEVLAGLGDSIGQRLRSITSKYRQGFGTFVDKVTMPFVLTVQDFLENPCFRKNETCARPYGFKNQMSLSNNTEEFSNVVNDVKLSASSDLPEGGFDALMQVIVCQKEIGWSEQARRLIIFATDAPFHFAGDGKLGGVLLPNDGKCHMDELGEYYTHSLIHDYPSIAQVNAKAKEHSVNIIFAVTSDEIADYNRLTNIIEGSKSTELAKNSSNIVDLVVQEYQKIQSKVEIKDSFPSEYFKVRYYSKCQGNGEEVERNFCEGLQAGTVVEFRVEIELTKCLEIERKQEWKQQYRIYAVGVPDSIEIDVEVLCDCPCENPENRRPNSPMCNNKGTEFCGLCDCNTNYFGKTCECSAEGGRNTDLSTACKNENSTEICSGRGNCICGQCTCTDATRYTGPFCECDNYYCPLTNGELCAGHGKCDCGTCKCDQGWDGVGCDCSTDKRTCFEPDSEEECSGQGSCSCGKCQCKGKYSGEYCEKCVHDLCPNKCEELKHCVQCKLHGTGIYNPADCELQCFQHVINKLEVVSPASDEVLCKAEDPSDECVFIFSYIALRNKKIHINAQIDKECPPQAPIFWIVASVSSLVVLIGLILLCVYKAYTKIQIKKEFAAYENERTGVVWGQQTNPIYNNPVGTFQNPLYAGAEK